jgi:hypothetical protein
MSKIKRYLEENVGNKPVCGDHLTDDCVCFDYMREAITSAERLVQLTKERKSILEPTINDIKKNEEESADVLR